MAEWYGARLAIARSWVRLPPVAAVYQRQLSVPSLRGRLMSSSLRATGWRPSAADWGGGMSVVLHRRSTCPLSRAVDGCIPRIPHTAPLAYGNQLPLLKLWSAADCSRVFSCKQRYIKYPDLYLYLLRHPSRAAVVCIRALDRSIFIHADLVMWTRDNCFAPSPTDPPLCTSRRPSDANRHIGDLSAGLL